MHTTSDQRGDYAKRSRNPQAFLSVSNVLEDGRIEALLKRDWPGSANYLDALLASMLQQNEIGACPLGGLVLYVRTKLWRNNVDAKFWQGHEGEIAQAIAAPDAIKVYEIAFNLVEALYGDAPKQTEGQQTQAPQDDEGGESSQAPAQEKQDAIEGEQESAASEQESEGDASDSDEGEEGASEGLGEGDESSDEGEASENEGETSESGEGEGEGEGEASASGEDTSEDTSEAARDYGDASGADASEGQPESVSGETWQKVKEIVASAMDNVKGETEGDLKAIITDAINAEPSQDFASGPECASASELTAMFESLAVEAARTLPVNTKAGILNTQALASALTTRKCFYRCDETPEPPAVALLIDVSASMGGRRDEAATQAARVLNGALVGAKIKAKVFTFGGSDELTEYRNVPIEPFICHGGTPTGCAVKAALDWLEGEGAQRSLVIVATDGAPNDKAQVVAQRKRAGDMGAYLIGVLIGVDAQATSYMQSSYMQSVYSDANLQAQFNEYVFAPDVALLPQLLEPKLAEFIASV